MPDPNIPNDTTPNTPSFDREEKKMGENEEIRESMLTVIEMFCEKNAGDVQKNFDFFGDLFKFFSMLTKLRQEGHTEEAKNIFRSISERIAIRDDYDGFEGGSSELTAEPVLGGGTPLPSSSEKSIKRKERALFSLPEEQRKLGAWYYDILKKLAEVKQGTWAGLKTIPYFVNECEKEDPKKAIGEIIGFCTSFKESIAQLLESFKKVKKNSEKNLQYVPEGEKEAFKFFCEPLFQEVGMSLFQAKIDNNLTQIVYAAKLHSFHSAIEWTVEKMPLADEILVMDGTLFFQKTDSFLNQIQVLLEELETNPYQNQLIRTKKEASLSIKQFLKWFGQSIPLFQPKAMVLLRNLCMRKMQLLCQTADRILANIVEPGIISAPLPSLKNLFAGSSAQKPSSSSSSAERHSQKLQALRTKLSVKKNLDDAQKNEEPEESDKKEKADAFLADLLREGASGKKKKTKKKASQPKVSLKDTTDEKAPISPEPSVRDDFLRNISTWVKKKKYDKIKSESQMLAEATEDPQAKFEYGCEYVKACVAELDHELQKALMDCCPVKLRTVHGQMVRQNKMMGQLLEDCRSKKNIEPGSVESLDEEMLQKMGRTAGMLNENIERITQSIKEKKDELVQRLAISKDPQKQLRLKEKINNLEAALFLYLKELEQPVTRLVKDTSKKAPRRNNKTGIPNDGLQATKATLSVPVVLENETLSAGVQAVLQKAPVVVEDNPPVREDEKNIEASDRSLFTSAACFLPPPAPPVSLPMQKEHWLAAFLPFVIRNFMMQVAQREGLFMALSGGALLRTRKGDWAHVVDWDFSTNLSRSEVDDAIKGAHLELFNAPWQSKYISSLSTAKFTYAPNKRADINSYTELSLHIEKLKAHAQKRSDFTVNALYLIATAQGFCLFDAARGVVINTAEEFDAIPEIRDRTLRLTKKNAQGEQDLESLRKNPILILRALKMIWTKGYTLEDDLKAEIIKNGKEILGEVMQDSAHPEHGHFQHYIQKELQPLWEERYHLEVMHNQKNPQYKLYVQQEFQQHFYAFLHLEAMHYPAHVIQQPDFLSYVQNKFAPIWDERCRLLLNNKNYTDAQTLLGELGLPDMQVLAKFANQKRPNFSAAAGNVGNGSESATGAQFFDSRDRREWRLVGTSSITF
jgi:hypothetical protein